MHSYLGEKKSQTYVSLKIILIIILRNVPLVILMQVLSSSYLEIHQIETKKRLFRLSGFSADCTLELPEELLNTFGQAPAPEDLT